MDRKEALEKIVEEIERIRRSFAIKRKKSACFKELTPVQWQIAAFIARKGSAIPSEISSYLGISKSATSQQLDILEQKGFIKAEISKTDKRQKIYRLTPKSSEFMKKSRKDFLNMLEEIFSKFSDEDLSDLLRILRKLTEDS